MESSCNSLLLEGKKLMSDYDMEIYKKDIRPIECDMDYERIGKVLDTLTELKEEVHKTFDPVIAQAHSAHKSALSARKKHEADLTYLIDKCKGVMLDYRDTLEEQQNDSVAIAHPLPDLDNISYRKTYTATVDDRKAFVQHVLDNWNEWNPVIQLRSAVLNKYARTMRNCGTSIPGLKIQQNQSLIVKKKKEDE